MRRWYVLDLYPLLFLLLLLLPFELVVLEELESKLERREGTAEVLALKFDTDVRLDRRISGMEEVLILRLDRFVDSGIVSYLIINVE